MPQGWPLETTGWGGRIRTCDPGTKTRCLATWLRPITDALALGYRKTARNFRDYTEASAGYQQRGLRPRYQLSVVS